jgi:transposase-like protein/IS1 family transposase
MVCHNCEALAKKHGRDRKGLQRYKCSPCNRTFTEYQDKPLDGMYLPLDKAVQIISMLLEGMSVRSIERLTGVEKHTILKLLVLAGNKADRLLNDKIRGLKVEDVQADELWAFVRMKDRTKHKLAIENERIGSCYTFVGIEANTKLVLAWQMGHRDFPNTIAFVEKLNRATSGQFQLSTDGMPAYRDAVVFNYELAERVDFAQLTKIYESGYDTNPTAKRYSPTKFIKAIPKIVWGRPDMDKLCTSHVERMNLNIRTGVKRFARLTLSFSKKWENLHAMTALYFAFYNFVRPHTSLSGATPVSQINASWGSGLRRVASLIRVIPENPWQKNEASRTREHMAGADVTVVDLGLRQQHFQLSADRYQLLVAEQCACTQATAVSVARTLVRAPAG